MHCQKESLILYKANYIMHNSKKCFDDHKSNSRRHFPQI